MNGNPSKKKLETNEPKPVPIAPKMFSWLAPEAKKCWRLLAPHLEKMGLLTIVDGHTFAAACENWAVWVECERFLQKNGRTIEIIKTNDDGEEYTSYIQQRPEVAIGNKALVAFKAFCTEFGLTPSSRTRIDIKSSDDEKDPIEAIINRRR